MNDDIELKPDPKEHLSIPGVPPQKALRTYEGDVAEVLANKRVSTASIALAETQKSTGEDSISSSEETSHVGRNIIIVVASLIFVCGGVVAAYYLYMQSPLAPVTKVTPQAQTPTSIVPSDTQAVVPIDGLNPLQTLALIRTEVAKTQSPSSIKEIILVKTQGAQRFAVTGPDMASLMGIGAPDVLLRALSDPWMLGVYEDPSGAKSVFIIATTDYFQNAFAGMLQWESVMADDLKQYLYQNSPADITTGAVVSSVPDTNEALVGTTSDATATSTISLASTSPTTASTTTSSPVQAYTASGLPPVILHGAFVDRIIQNKDVREFVTNDGKVLFLYSFIDNNHLVVAGSEDTLGEILKRLEQQTYIR